MQYIMYSIGSEGELEREGEGEGETDKGRVFEHNKKYSRFNGNTRAHLNI